MKVLAVPAPSPVGFVRVLLRLGVAVVLAASLVLDSTNAHADEVPEGPPNFMKPIREAHERGDFQEVRRLLLEAYTLVPSPQLLFALGQVELQLGNYQSAINYYEKYIATNPKPEQVGLAQQGIGAARIKLAQSEEPDEPPPPPPPPQQPERPRVPPRQWYIEDTGFVALGATAIAVGGGLLYYSHRLGEDRSGSLSDYDRRVAQSRTTKLTGIGVAAGGALVIGVTLLRWRLRPDGSDLSASVSPGSATVALTTRW